MTYKLVFNLEGSQSCLLTLLEFLKEKSNVKIRCLSLMLSMMKGLEDFQYFWESQKWHPKATEMKLLPMWHF
jgi:hypothetical protein